MSKPTIFSLLLSPLVILTQVDSAPSATQCTCPSIAADGKGNTSCSATEAISRCTVDFNEFGEDMETKSQEFAVSISGRSIERLQIDFFAREFAQSQEPSIIASQLIVYMGVSIVEHEAFLGGEWDAEAFSHIITTILDNDEEVAATFVRGGVFETDDLFVTDGCIEARYEDAWTMYKTFWSAVSQAPQCRRY